MTEFELLAQAFEFDAWANRQWLEYLDSTSADETDRAIFGHLLGVEELWYRRCLGEAVPAVPSVPQTRETIDDLLQKWVSVLQNRSDNPLIHFHRFNGEPMHQRVSRIAWHVIDHGTYHRGELRGLCRARGVEDFPETGLFIFHREKGLDD